MTSNVQRGFYLITLFVLPCLVVKGKDNIKLTISSSPVFLDPASPRTGVTILACTFNLGKNVTQVYQIQIMVKRDNETHNETIANLHFKTSTTPSLWIQGYKGRVAVLGRINKTAPEFSALALIFYASELKTSDSGIYSCWASYKRGLSSSSKSQPERLDVLDKAPVTPTAIQPSTSTKRPFTVTDGSDHIYVTTTAIPQSARTKHSQSPDVTSSNHDACSPAVTTVDPCQPVTVYMLVIAVLSTLLLVTGAICCLLYRQQRNNFQGANTAFTNKSPTSPNGEQQLAPNTRHFRKKHKDSNKRTNSEGMYDRSISSAFPSGSYDNYIQPVDNDGSDECSLDPDDGYMKAVYKTNPEQIYDELS